MVVYLGFLKKLDLPLLRNWRISPSLFRIEILAAVGKLDILCKLSSNGICQFSTCIFHLFCFVFVTLMFCVLIIDKADLKCNGLLQLLQFLHHPLDNKLPQLPRLYCYCSSPSPTIYVPSRTTTIHLSFDQCELHRVKNHLCH